MNATATNKLNARTVKDLRKTAARLHVTGYSKLTKAALVEAISDRIDARHSALNRRAALNEAAARFTDDDARAALYAAARTNTGASVYDCYMTVVNAYGTAVSDDAAALYPVMERTDGPAEAAAPVKPARKTGRKCKTVFTFSMHDAIVGSLTYYRTARAVMTVTPAGMKRRANKLETAAIARLDDRIARYYLSVERDEARAAVREADSIEADNATVARRTIAGTVDNTPAGAYCKTYGPDETPAPEAAYVPPTPAEAFRNALTATQDRAARDAAARLDMFVTHADLPEVTPELIDDARKTAREAAYEAVVSVFRDTVTDYGLDVATDADCMKGKGGYHASRIVLRVSGFEPVYVPLKFHRATVLPGYVMARKCGLDMLTVETDDDGQPVKDHKGRIRKHVNRDACDALVTDYPAFFADPSKRELTEGMTYNVIVRNDVIRKKCGRLGGPVSTAVNYRKYFNDFKSDCDARIHVRLDRREWVAARGIDVTIRLEKDHTEN